MKGQPKITEWIDSVTFDTMPHTVMICGARGSGKHLVTEMIRDKLNLPSVNITNDLNRSTLESILLSSSAGIYVIECDNITVRNQNTILKFIEEPLHNIFILLLSADLSKLLPTVRSRAFPLVLNKYDRDILKSFVTKEYDDVAADKIVSVAETPGDVVYLCGHNVLNYIELADKLLSKLHVASLPNTLSIADKVGYALDQKECELSYFLRVLMQRASIMCAHNPKSTSYSYKLMCDTQELMYKISSSTGNKKHLFENYLIQEWEAVSDLEIFNDNKRA